ncbi:universal stress protein [Ramlibacter tataouinensis]|uniref:universal stress protein n=1 Tax=Ramlibacter tataouinensis TaxID=94132 RepID=UPI0022F3E8DB|nr:universal stress protein [Ramlibacter tataouinensis]WBY00369.1 universal stress protein [Ramlibacter tataouinensis]
MPNYQRILVPVDGSATALQAMATAIEFARASGGRMLAVHAVEELAFVAGMDYSGQLLTVAREAGAKSLQEAAQRARDAGVEVETRLLEHTANRLGESIAQAAQGWNADLIVVGTHGRRGMGRLLLGSGAEQIIRLAPVPVLVIRGSEID